MRVGIGLVAAIVALSACAGEDGGGDGDACEEAPEGSGELLWVDQVGLGDWTEMRLVSSLGHGEVIAAGYSTRSEPCDPSMDPGCDVALEFTDLVLRRYSVDGLMWSRGYAVEGSVMPKDIAVTPDGDIVVAGYFQGLLTIGETELQAGAWERRSGFVARFSGDGEPVWALQFPRDQLTPAHGIAVDGAGDILVAGEFSGRVSFGGASVRGAQDEAGDLPTMYIVKLSGDGEHLWSRGLAELGQSAAFDIASGPNGLLAVAGEAARDDACAPWCPSFLGVFDADAVEVWSAPGPEPRSIEFTRRGDLAVGGEYGARVMSAVDGESVAPLLAGGPVSDVAVGATGDIALAGLGAVVKRTCNGAPVWLRTIDGDDLLVESVAVTDSGAVVAVGRFSDVTDFGEVQFAAPSWTDGFVAAYGP